MAIETDGFIKDPATTLEQLASQQSGWVSPVEAPNDVLTTFTCPSSDVPAAGTLEVSHNGQHRFDVTDNGDGTFDLGSAPETGATLKIRYWRS